VPVGDGGERREQTWVDAAGEEVGALHSGEHDPRVAQQLADRRGIDGQARAGTGRAAVDGGLGEDVGDVPVGVVVREQGGAVVPGGARLAQKAGRGRDRVGWVVGGAAAVAVAVDAVSVPGRGWAVADIELHRSGAAH
jgi:hypothetical protein